MMKAVQRNRGSGCLHLPHPNPELQSGAEDSVPCPDYRESPQESPQMKLLDQRQKTLPAMMRHRWTEIVEA